MSTLSERVTSLEDKLNNQIEVGPEDITSVFKGVPTGAILKAVSALSENTKPQPATVIYKDYNYNMYREFQVLSKNVDFIQTALRVIETSIFKKQLIWKQKFSCKCPICNWEYDNDLEECENCNKTLEQFTSQIKKLEKANNDGKGDSKISKLKENYDKLQKEVAVNVLIKPDRARMLYWKNWWESPIVSEFGQSGEQVLRENERNKSVFDDAPLFARLEFSWKPNGELHSKKLLSLEALDVLSWDKNIDENTKRMKDEYVCVYGECKYDRRKVFSKKDYGKYEGKCPSCGKQLFQAFHKVKYADGDEYYFAQFEINHTMYFNPGKYRGRSVFFGMYMLVMSKIGMDREVFLRYYAKKFPDTITGIITSERDLESMKAELIENAEKGYPQFVRIAPPGPDAGKIQSPVVTFPLRDVGITELMNSDSRREIQNTVNRSLGLVPMASSDTGSFSALRGEGEQLAMLGSEISSRQENVAENTFPWLLDLMGIDDYIIEFPEPSVDPEEEKRKEKEQNINDMVKMTSAGFDAKLISQKTMEFEYSGVGTRTVPFEEESTFTQEKDESVEKGVVSKAFEQKTYADMSQDLTKVINQEVAKGTAAGLPDSEILLNIEAKDEWQSWVKKQHPGLGLAEALEAEDHRLDMIIRDQGSKIDRERAIKESEEDDPSGDELKYEWLGRPLGSPRLSKECESIIRNIPPEGATRNQIKKLINQFGDPKTKDLDSFSPHINCSHTISEKVI